MFNLKFFKKMFKTKEYKKEYMRGVIKEIMKSRGLRSISFSNYLKFKKASDVISATHGIHSIKINIENGYLYMYGFNGKNPLGKMPGRMFEDVTYANWNDAYNILQDILSNEATIPTKIKKNILVKVTR